MDLSAHNNLVETEWLEDNLDNPTIRIIECTSLLPNYFEEDADQGLVKESGLSLWEDSHIVGSGFADILGELSDQSNTHFMYAMPGAEQFSAVMSSLGVGDGIGVVLYDRQVNMWASRLWVMLRRFGFDNAVVLNGGWTKWEAEGRPVSNDKPQFPRTVFKAKPRGGVIATHEDVLEAIQDQNSALINALDPDEFAGRGPKRYARAGRISSSVNVPFSQTADPETSMFKSDDELKDIFGAVNTLNKNKLICYCGGGIAASSTTLLLTRLGIENVALYDGSMQEWASDSSLPMEYD